MSGKIAYCGLDVGITTTDAVAGWDEQKAVSLRTTVPAESAERALSLLIERAGLPQHELVLAATGVGSRQLGVHVCGYPVRRVSEIHAIGRGGIGLGGGSAALVASLGTGTAMVSVRGSEVTHVTPGNGVGGGTLLGLARALLGTDDLAELAQLATQGDRRRLDITIGEAVGGRLGTLPEDGTAANFAKYARGASRADVAASLLNLVAEVVLWTVLLGLQASGHTRAVLTGKLLLVGPIRRRVEEIGSMLGDRLVVPQRGEVASALGALWSIREGMAE